MTNPGHNTKNLSNPPELCYARALSANLVKKPSRLMKISVFLVSDQKNLRMGILYQDFIRFASKFRKI